MYQACWKKAKANEETKLANETWFRKFSDVTTLQVKMDKLEAWNTTMIEVKNEKNGKLLLMYEPESSNPIGVNNAKIFKCYSTRLYATD